jgi:hypothetical protein
MHGATHIKIALQYVYYIYKHSYMFRPLWAIFRELYTVEYDLVVKQYAVNIKQYVVEVVS